MTTTDRPAGATAPALFYPSTRLGDVTLNIIDITLCVAYLFVFAYNLYLTRRNAPIHHVTRAVTLWPICAAVDVGLLITQALDRDATGFVVVLFGLLLLVPIYQYDKRRLIGMKAEACSGRL